MNSYLRQLFGLAGLTLFGFVVYLLLFLGDIAGSISILFYRGVILAFGAAIITGMLALWFSRRTRDSSLPIAAAALSLSFNLCFLVLLPVTIDRSISIYLLSTIERGESRQITSRALKTDLIDGYVVRMNAVNRRLDEQRRSGNISIDAEGTIRLTLQGARFMAFSRMIAKLFHTDPRLVDGYNEPPTNAQSNLSLRKKS